MAPRHGSPPRIDVTACLHEPREDKVFPLDLMDASLFDPDEGA